MFFSEIRGKRKEKKGFDREKERERDRKEGMTGGLNHNTKSLNRGLDCY